MNLRKILATAAATIALAIPAKAQTNDFKLIDPNMLRHPFVQTEYVSDYVSGSGGAVRGGTIQSYAEVPLNKKLSFAVFQNYSFDEGAVNERDYIANWTQPIKGTPFTASASAQYWGYPSGTFGDFDVYTEANIAYSGKIDARFSWRHLMWQSATRNGEQFNLNISKPLPLIKSKDKGWSLTAIPSVSAAAMDNWYGSSGPAHITPKLALEAKKGGLTLKASVSEQISVNKDRHSFSYWSAGASFAF